MGTPERSALLGVHSLDHIALTVPDLAQGAHFYDSFGLLIKPQGVQASIYTEGSAHRWALLMEGKSKRLHHLSFGIFADDLVRFKALLSARNVPVARAPIGLESDGLWVRDPDGLLIELKVAEKSSPDSKNRPSFFSSREGEAGAPKRSAAPRVKPSRLSHVLVFTRSVPKAIEFFCNTLGLKLSDRSGDDIAFLHGVHGSDHHLIAFARSEGPGLHHCCWDVGSLQEIGLGASYMAAQGYDKGWGLGRHVLGSNYFHYVRDPWGSHCEYSCDMDYIPVHYHWQARDHDAEDAFYIWGPKPPLDWTENHELIGSSREGPC
jgi:catechol 2,3-dioxygenase-like lactoylglutathione lyase family enzyme